MPFYICWMNISTVSGMRNTMAIPLYLTSVETATLATSRWQSDVFLSLGLTSNRIEMGVLIISEINHVDTENGDTPWVFVVTPWVEQTPLVVLFPSRCFEVIVIHQRGFWSLGSSNGGRRDPTSGFFTGSVYVGVWIHNWMVENIKLALW